MEEDWFYETDGAAVGPVNLAALTVFLSIHPDPKNVQVWRSDFQEWRMAAQGPGLKRLTVRPPPLPLKAAPPASKPDPSALNYVPVKLPQDSGQAATIEASAPAQNRSVVTTVVTIAAWIVGFGAGKVLGANFWLPAIL